MKRAIASIVLAAAAPQCRTRGRAIASVALTAAAPKRRARRLLTPRH